MPIMQKEKLKDGIVLNLLIKEFTKNPTGENLYSIMLCLIDSDVQVPMSLTISKEDAEMMKNSKAGDKVSLKNDMRLRPDLLQSPNTKKIYFPIFSTIKDATEEYSKNFSWINMSIDDCIDFVDNNKDCSGIIINAFTTPIILEEDIYIFLKNKLKEIRKEENKE